MLSFAMSRRTAPSRNMRCRWLHLLALFAAGFARADAGAITAERIAQLAAEQQQAWLKYTERSRAEMAADRNAIYAELEGERLVDWTAPREGPGVADRLKNTAEWFAGAEAQRIADVVISFQTPAGGWGKGIDLRTRPRQPGERFSSGGSGWSYVGTFDNGATVTELRFLARASRGAAFERGLGYVLRAQFPNGGWPQVYPLMGGYHDAITFNDNAMVNVLRLLRDVAGGRNEFANMSAEIRVRAAKALARGIACALATQVRGAGWGQQHDALTLAPTTARAFEMTALASAESAGILRFLMELDDPDSAVIGAAHSAAVWLRAVPTVDEAWARFYEIGTDRPLFGARDGSIHFDVREISRERREGYAWFSKSPAAALEKYEKWKAKHPLKP